MSLVTWERMTRMQVRDFFRSDNFFVFDAVDETKGVSFDVSKLATGSDIVLTMPTSDLDLGNIIATTANYATTAGSLTGLTSSIDELNFSDGVTSNIQTQIDSKLTAARGNWKMFYSNGTGVFTELSLGDSGKVLQANGATAAPTWEVPSAGGVGFDAIFMLMGA